MAKGFATIFGIVYLLIGILGFVPGTGGTFAMSPPTMLLHYFPINVLHNIVHVIIGIAGLASMRTEASAASFCKVFGIFLIVIGIVGFFWPPSLDQSFLPLRGSDVWLHLVSGIILALVGLAAKPARATA